MFAGLIQRCLLRTPLAAVPASTASTWNPADKTAGVTLSGGNLTATFSGSDGVRGTPGFTDKRYWEIEATAMAPNFFVGVADSSATLDTTSPFIGDSGNSHGASYDTSGGAYANGSFAGSPASATTSDRIGIAVDAANKLFWFAKNNVWQLSGDPAAGTGGLSISVVSGALYPDVQSKFGTSVAVLHASAASQTYSPPSGFSALG